MESEVSRTRARRNFGERRIVGRDRRLAGVQSVLHHLVQTEIRHKQKPVVRREEHAVRMRTALPPRVHARAAVLDQHRRLAQAPVGAHRYCRDAPSAVVRHQQRAAGLVQYHVARAAANRRDAVQLRERAGLPVDRECRDRPVLLSVIAQFAYRIQKLATGMNRHPGRIDHLSSQPHRLEIAGAGVIAKGVDALALRSCVCAHVNEVLGLLHCRARERGAAESENQLAAIHDHVFYKTEMKAARATNILTFPFSSPTIGKDRRNILNGSY